MATCYEFRAGQSIEITLLKPRETEELQVPANLNAGPEGTLPNASGPNLILPSDDDLFSSGTLGRYSGMPEDVLEKRMTQCPESAENVVEQVGESCVSC